MEPKSILISTSYFAPIEYYAALYKFQNCWLEKYEFFEKQTYRNRCEILGANGKLALTIPLLNRKNKALTKDIRIDNKTPWQVNHWRTIESAYSSSPFFEYFCDDLLPFYSMQFEFLFEFNMALQLKMTELLGLKINCNYTSEYKQASAEQRDFRNNFSPKIISKTQFTKYIQVFENKFDFIPNLSILDLLFNLGNESEDYLKSIQL
jgi:hypothetical protein